MVTSLIYCPFCYNSTRPVILLDSNITNECPISFVAIGEKGYVLPCCSNIIHENGYINLLQTHLVDTIIENFPPPPPVIEIEDGTNSNSSQQTTTPPCPTTTWREFGKPVYYKRIKQGSCCGYCGKQAHSWIKRHKKWHLTCRIPLINYFFY